MNYDAYSDSELRHMKAKLELQLLQLRASIKNYNHTIRNITDDMRAYRLKHQILIENPQEAPRA